MAFKKGEDNLAKRPEIRKKISEALKGRIFSEEWKNKLKLNRANIYGENNPNYGNHTFNGTEETKRKISKASKKWWANPDNLASRQKPKKLRLPIICPNCKIEFLKIPKRKFCSRKCFITYFKDNNPNKLKSVREAISNTLKNKWKNDPKYVENLLNSLSRRPTKPELYLDKLFKLNNVSLDYVGDCSFWVGPCISGKRRNPDFINKPKKKILLFNGKHWHNPETDIIEIEDYKNKGFDVLTINEDNLNENDLLIKIGGWLKSDFLTQ